MEFHNEQEATTMSGKRIIFQTSFVLAGLILGLLLGWWLSPEQAYNSGNEVEPAATSQPEFIGLSESAFRNLDLKITRVEIRPFSRELRLPGRVIENPGTSRRAVTAPFTRRDYRTQHRPRSVRWAR